MSRLWSRRSIPWIGALLLSPGLPVVALAKPEGVQSGTSLAGQLLVAAPEMQDPRFRHVVIMMVQHDAKGALGIAINRPTRELPVAQLLASLGIDNRGTDGTVRIYAGGPVQPQIGFVLHSAEYHRSGTLDIDGKIAMTRNPEVLRDIG